MKLDIQYKSDKFKFYFPMLLVFSLPMIAYPITSTEPKAFYFGIAGGVALITYIVLLIRRPHFFSIQTKYSDFLVRFYNTHVFFSKPKAYQIKNSSFSDYKITEKFNGFQKSIAFQIKKEGKKGWYPPISISLLSKNELKVLKKELDTILKINKL